MTPDYNYPLPLVPLVPADILRKHFVFEPLDHRFRSAARLLQALWREDRDLPIGSYRLAGRRYKLGSRISDAAGREGLNFLSPDIAYLVRRELSYREPGALIDEYRLSTNLLSSMPMTFNLLGLLHLDHRLAERVLIKLFAELEGITVRAVWFEHSPGRGDPNLTGDHSAFDAFIHYTRPSGAKGFVAFEVKYSESCQEPVPNIRARYDDIATVSGLFNDPLAPLLRANPLQQIFREHMLAEVVLMRGDYAEGKFVMLAPRLNTLVGRAVETYREQLQPIGTDHAGFASVTIEEMIAAIAAAGQEQYAHKLHRRYVDFLLVDGELELGWFNSPRELRPDISSANDNQPAVEAEVRA